MAKRRNSIEKLRNSIEKLRDSIDKLRDSINNLRDSMEKLRDSMAKLSLSYNKRITAGDPRPDRYKKITRRTKGLGKQPYNKTGEQSAKPDASIKQNTAQAD